MTDHMYKYQSANPHIILIGYTGSLQFNKQVNCTL